MRSLKLLPMVVAAGLLLGLGHVVIHAVVGPKAQESAGGETPTVARANEEVAEPGEEPGATGRLYAFVYGRGPVQHVILAVAAFALVLLYRRQRYYWFSAGQLGRFERKKGNPPEPLAEGLRTVGRSNVDYGAAAARSQIERFHDDRSQAVQQDYELVRFVVGSLPVLGLLGTMLGLSDALYGAFSQGLFGDAQVKAFVTGLSSALDTTVLAMLFAAPLFAWTALLVRQESRLVDRYAEFLRDHFGLSDVPEGDKGAYAIYAELCRLTKQIGQDAKAMFADLLDTSAAAMRENLADAVQKHLDEHHQSQREAARAANREIADQVDEAARAISQALQQQNRELAEQVVRSVAENTRSVTENVAQPLQSAAEEIRGHLESMSEQLPESLSRSMADSLARAAALADQRQASLAEGIAQQMGRLESAIRNRTPEEVVIRYRENGKLHHQGV